MVTGKCHTIFFFPSFSWATMKLVETNLQSQIVKEFLSECLVLYIKKIVFSIISNMNILNTFQKRKTCQEGIHEFFFSLMRFEFCYFNVHCYSDAFIC